MSVTRETAVQGAGMHLHAKGTGTQPRCSVVAQSLCFVLSDSRIRERKGLVGEEESVGGGEMGVRG